MDPYARLRIGHTIYETHACGSGGKTPRWNKRIQWLVSCPDYEFTPTQDIHIIFFYRGSYLPVGVKAISVEVYDECALTMDELIGYGQIPIPEAVFRGESVDEWFQLSGKQGENKEGSIHLIFTLVVTMLDTSIGVKYLYCFNRFIALSAGLLNGSLTRNNGVRNGPWSCWIWWISHSGFTNARNHSTNGDGPSWIRYATRLCCHAGVRQ